MEGIRTGEADLVVYVHPSQSRNINQAVLRQLSSMLLKFSEIFDGVVLAYEVKFQDKLAKIITGVHPYCGVRLKAELLLFSPKPDMLLEGKVVKVTQEFINVIVLGFSSAVISAEDIRDEFRHRIRKHGEGLYFSKYHKQHMIKVGTSILFTVKSLDEDMLHISGSLIAAHTGSKSWLDEEKRNTKIGNKKRTQPNGEIEMQGHETAYSIDDNRAIKKSKKHKNAEDC
ncbi:uncharacterized protein LOC126670722 isoform X2 [Mercurialis annua]|uniref:uncharacterized protein LOC126670722 isoform X2 n=1 Tax=Mercurialis annua TaxID=3986 RepID=UPI00215FDD2A|nr:uncharacterized protein LOC126670722 isoform X2 [Mercurialis annua]